MFANVGPATCTQRREVHLPTAVTHRAANLLLPRHTDKHELLEAILWILHTGAPWAKLPAHFRPRSTCLDRFQEWNRNGTLQRTAGRRTPPTGQAQAFGVLYRCLLCCR
ncbi:transposase [Rhodothermus marinus]|uniref:transposase n=1 Tax=Rhodothermus marinus TaxID=29549 RepID=UPI0009D7796A